MALAAAISREIRYPRAADHIRGRLRAVRSLTRALHIAKSMNQHDLRKEVAQDIVALASDLLDTKPVPFGPVIELLEPPRSTSSCSDPTDLGGRSSQSVNGG